MANVLALDVLADVASAACVIDGRLFSHTMLKQKHADALGACVQALLQKEPRLFSKLAMVVVNVGPGSFTGVRVGLASAQALCFAHKLPVWAVSHLLGCAYQYHWSQYLGPVASGQEVNAFVTQSVQWPCVRYAVAMDARMQEAYVADVQSQSSMWLDVATEDALCAMEVLVQRRESEDSVLLGDAWGGLQSRLDVLMSWSEVMAMVAYKRYPDLDLLPIASVRPNYLRNQVTG